MARKDAGLTQSTAAKALGCGQGKINKIETTLVAIKPDELDKLLELYQVSADQAADLRLLVPESGPQPRRDRWASAWPAFDRLSDLEPDASEILCWHSERIPRHLQSERFMLRQVTAGPMAESDVTQPLRHWKARARILMIEDPPRYQAILSESSLLRMRGGGRGLVVDQIIHMLDLLGQHKQLTIRILRFDADIPFVDTDFEILRFADQDAIAYNECPGGAQIFEDTEQFVEHWQQLSHNALSCDDSIRLMEELAESARHGKHDK